MITASGWDVLTCSGKLFADFRGPIGEVWNSSLQIQHRNMLMSASGTRSRNASAATMPSYGKQRRFANKFSNRRDALLPRLPRRSAQRCRCIADKLHPLCCVAPALHEAGAWWPVFPLVRDGSKRPRRAVWDHHESFAKAGLHADRNIHDLRLLLALKLLPPWDPRGEFRRHDLLLRADIISLQTS